ncbi:MAG TPA: MFS transporter [Gaiellaceae bacterium]|nr:MFS transporter [Gaiellaceae bacterium]
MLRSFRERLADAREAFASVFTNPNLRRVELSWAGTVSAYWMFIVTLAFYAYERGGPEAVGLVGLLRVVPSFVAAPFGAMLGDRYPRERVIVGINVARSLTIAVAALVAFIDGPPVIVYVLASLMGLLQSTFRPTQAALLPLLARTPEELTAANLVLTTVESVGLFVGPAVGGLLLAAAGAETVFSVAAGVFLIAALLLAGVQAERSDKPLALRGSFLSEAFAGFRTVLRDSRLRLVIGLYGLQTLAAGALNVLVVVVALEVLDLGKAGIGFLNSAIGVGGLLGGVLAVALVAHPRLASAFGLGLALVGAPIALMAVAQNTAAALVLLGLVGLGITIVDVAGLTLLQRAVPDEVLTRVMGVVQSVFVGTLGLGAILAPLLIALVGNRGALVATGAVLPVVAALTWPMLRMVDAEIAQAPRHLDLLRDISIFRPLPGATLEQLARDLRPVHVPAGDEIVRQGEPGDRFYIVSGGEVDVRVDGGPPTPLRAGQFFGEIALLRNVPRTATVTARTEADLLALERDQFINIVTGHPESDAAAQAVVSSRLGSLPSIASI